MMGQPEEDLHIEKKNFMYRRSKSLTYFLHGTEIIIYNFLSNRSFICNIFCLEILLKSSDWQPIENVFTLISDKYTSSVVEEIIQLFSLTALVVQGDPIADLDEEFSNSWEWGTLSGALHYSAKDNPTVCDQLATDIQILRSSSEPSPSLYTRSQGSDAIYLPGFQTDCELHAVMRMRRSVRAFKDEPITLSTLSDILFSGLGIVGIVQTPAGDLPLKMTPSPGARNPYEAYIFSNNVNGLSSCTFYHYSAFSHALSPVRLADIAPPSMEAMFAYNQQWVSKASAIVLLVAHFERVMWKYLNGSAYGSVLIEAGHIAQNMALVANKHRLVANPVGAISHSLIERAIGEKQLSHSVIYALAMGVPDIESEDVRWMASEFDTRSNLMEKFKKI